MSEREILTCYDCGKRIESAADQEAYADADLCANCYNSQKDWNKEPEKNEDED